MKIELILNNAKKIQELETSSTLQTLLKMHKINSQTVIMMINGEVSHPSTILKDNDSVEILGVIYGG